MALTTGGATSDRVNCGSAAGLDNASSLSIAMWVHPTTLTANRRLMSKARGSGSVGWALELSGTGGNLAFTWNRATTGQSFISNNTPLSTLNKWYCVLATSSGTGDAVHIYVGDLTTSMVEATYGTSTAGSGALVADAARSLLIANRDDATPATAFQGLVAIAGFWYNRVLTLDEGVAWQFKPGFYHPEMKLFMRLGENGTGTQVDLTGNGNNGTVTGATVGDGVPLGAPYGEFDSEPYVVAAGTIPPPYLMPRPHVHPLLAM